jgi:betaine lipid synthase
MTRHSRSFYTNGYSGLALRLAQIIFTLAGVSKDAGEILQRLHDIGAGENTESEADACASEPSAGTFSVSHSTTTMLLDEGSIYEFVKDTPIPLTCSFKEGAHFYPLVRS